MITRCFLSKATTTLLSLLRLLFRFHELSALVPQFFQPILILSHTTDALLELCLSSSGRSWRPLTTRDRSGCTSFRRTLACDRVRFDGLGRRGIQLVASWTERALVLEGIIIVVAIGHICPTPCLSEIVH